jgi:integrase
MARGKGEGSIYQDATGCWRATVDLGRENGKRRRKYLRAKTKRELLQKLASAQQALAQGLPLPAERQTVGQFLDAWLRDVVKAKVRPLSYVAYESKITLHVKPIVGHIRLAKLTPQDVQNLMNRKLGDGLSPRTVRELRGILRTALNQALRWGLIARNVAALTEPPKVEEHEIQPLEPDQAQKFLEAARGDRLAALYTVALAIGLRQGEALGLRWEDVDLDGGILRVRMQLQRIDGTLRLAELKTKRSRRTIVLPLFAVTALREHRVRQLEERLLVGATWQESGLVFTTQIGTALDARNVVRQFDKLRKRVGLDGFRFHDTRHTCATFLLLQGVPDRVVMEILGHSQISMTARYEHVVTAMKQEAAEKMEALFTRAR